MSEVDGTNPGRADRGDAPASADVRGEGDAADGQVLAVASRGRLTRVEVAPRLMGSPAEELASDILTAVNAAFDDLRAHLPTAEAIDPAVLAARLGEFQEQALLSMSKITEAISGAMEKLRDRTTIHGDPSPKGLEHLLEETRNLVDAVAGSAKDTPQVEGEGSAADGRIRVVAPPGGRLTSLEIDRRALRMASEELAAHVVTAVNAALDDLEAKSREQSEAPRVDRRRLQALRETSTEQMASYTRALRDLMAGIERREGP
ncbi:YbaB/EbfC family nucleoid-associated protein [Actinoallomurus purpureus]|uniref:YbaB/EbfC family nucleoid-associated protein n=1 Tax=Actinoallomurus purpureus TaxID=478114 RepID=UPI00209306A0|nr:YbaB/EbfC family nucleoid-associated protein [Actinoallomurus purpureus]MCO6011602.1 YbaB/EbfC family nucleoid-associated protein [Actinoallomurus purpureus]